MKLFLLRHGAAEDGGPDLPDEQRALTEAGRAQVQHAAQALHRFASRPTIAFTSPLVRARQTAAIVAEVLAIPLHETDALQPGCSLDALGAALRGVEDEHVLVVGHEPDFSGIAARLCIADERGIILKKGGLIRIDIDGRVYQGRGRLTALLTPSMLTLMSDGEIVAPIRRKRKTGAPAA